MKKILGILLLISTGLMAQTNTPLIPNVTIQRLRSDTVNVVVRFQTAGVNMNVSADSYKFALSESTTGLLRLTLSDGSGITRLDSATLSISLTTQQVNALTKDVYQYRLYKDNVGQITRLYGAFWFIKGTLNNVNAVLNTNMIVVNYNANATTTANGGVITNNMSAVEIRNALATLTGSNRLDTAAIKNIPSLAKIRSYFSAGTGIGYNSSTGVISNTGITGSGTTNYIPKFSASSTLGNSQIFDNGTNVLINQTTDNGLGKLQVNGSVWASANFVTPFSLISSGSVPIALDASGTADIWMRNGATFSVVNQAYNAYSFRVFNSGAVTANTRLGVGIAAEASFSASAALQVNSTTQGVLFPRMTTTQRDAISSPTAGLVIFNTTADKLQIRTSSTWVDLH